MLTPPTSLATTCMPPTDYVLLLKWHLGVPIIPIHYSGRRCAACGRAVDPFGDHAVMCPCSAFHDRHLGANNFVCRVLQEAGIPHRREQSVDGSGSRPADILLPGFARGQDVAVDITITHPIQVHRAHGFGAAKLAMEGARREKYRAHQQTCSRVGVRFEPLVMDTWGGVHGGAGSIWSSIVQAASRGLRVAERAARLGALRQGLSLSVVRTVARQLASLPLATDPAPAEDGANDELIGAYPTVADEEGEADLLSLDGEG